VNGTGIYTVLYCICTYKYSTDIRSAPLPARNSAVREPRREKADRLLPFL